MLHVHVGLFVDLFCTLSMYRLSYLLHRMRKIGSTAHNKSSNIFISRVGSTMSHSVFLVELALITRRRSQYWHSDKLPQGMDQGKGVEDSNGKQDCEEKNGLLSQALG